MTLGTSSPTPHLAERRVLKRVEAARVRPFGLAGTPRGRQHTSDDIVLVTGPTSIIRSVLAVIGPLAPRVEEWDGRSPRPSPALVVAAMPWRYDAVGDVPELPGPLQGPRPDVLPLSFTNKTVTVGPVAGPSGDVCLDCVHPALACHTPRPDPRSAPALTAFAAGACGLFLRAYQAEDRRALSMSLTFDICAPQVEHRIWTCTSGCARAA